jgi:dTDP-4-dehydrorhamnose reductase
VRVLVTGVSGQVGGALVSRLAGQHIVIAATRDMLDLSRPEAIADQLDEIVPDVIVNPAAYTAVDQAEDERDLAFAINAEAPGVMARWAVGRGVPLVHLSTDYVFDGGGERPWREDDEPRPLSVYGGSKLAGERAVRAADGPHLLVRTSWVYAATGKNFLRTIMRLAGDRPELKVVSDQVGAPTPARVIADGIGHILHGDASELRRRFSAAGGLVHLATAGHTSWHGFAVTIVEGLKARHAPVKAERIIPIRTEEYPTKAVRPRNSRLDLARLKLFFGIDPPQWEAALALELDLMVGRGCRRSTPRNRSGAGALLGSVPLSDDAP